MKISQELTAFLSPESTPIHKRQVNGIGSIFNNNRSRLPFVIAFSIGLPIVLGIAGYLIWYKTKRRRGYFAGDRQPPARGNQTWGKRRARNVRPSSGLRAGNGDDIEPPPPVYTGTVANPNKNTPGLPTQDSSVGGSSSEAPPSYTDATATEEGRARV